MSDTLSAVKDRLAAVATAPALQSSMKRHYENLETLAKSLQSLGMDDQEVDRNVLAVFEEYERELLRTISHLREAASDE